MQVVQFWQLLVVSTPAIVGCNRDVQKPINPDAVVSTDLGDIHLPERVPNFSVFDFGLAEIDEENADQVLYGRALFRSRQVKEEQAYQVSRLVTIEKEFTDAAGQKQTRIEEREVPENQTREVFKTVYEGVDPQILSCPVQSMTALDHQGKKLSVEEMRNALVDGCRVVLRSTDSPDEPFYGGFFDSNTLFIHSNEWIEVSFAAAPITEATVAPMPVIPDLLPVN